MATWWHKDESKFGFMDNVSRCLLEHEYVSPGAFPDLRRARDLLVTMDFSGQDADSSHFVISTYITPRDDLNPVLAALQHWRSTALRDKRRLSFKKLRDRRRWQAMPQFHNIIQDTTGLLAMFAFDKKDTGIIGEYPKEPPASLSSQMEQAYRPNVLRRALITLHVLGMLFRGMTAPGQNILWVLDDDEVVGSREKLELFVRAAKNIHSHYLPHNLGIMQVGVASTADDGTRLVEDLLSVPDLVAGAFSELFTASVNGKRPPIGAVRSPVANTVSEKARVLINWFGWNQKRLRTIAVKSDLINQGQSREIQVLDFVPDPDA